MPDTVDFWGKIVIGGRFYPIEWPKYVNFMMDPNFNAHTPHCINSPECDQWGGIHPYATHEPGGDSKINQQAAGIVERFRPRFRIRRELQKFQQTPYGNCPVDVELSVAQAAITQFVLHHDGCMDAAMCFTVLHNERGLSCHYILDNDGTIYQTLDLLAAGYHAQFLNDLSIGMEICNRGDAHKEPDYYSRHHMQRDIVTCTINGCKIVAFDFTPEQKAAAIALGRALAKHLPGIKLDYPKDPVTGKPLWGTMPDGGKSWSGYIGHYHSIIQKWDPGPFDFEEFIRKVRGGRHFPLALGDASSDIPEEKSKRDAAAETYYADNEREYTDDNGVGKPTGGFYPIGPFDQSRLWHGGIHLHAPLGTPVTAITGGKVVAARVGELSPGIGSINFVLVKHEIASLGIEFHLLYFHIITEGGKGGGVPHWSAAEAISEADPGTVVVFDPPIIVEGGDLLGFVGPAGPEDEPQIHFEAFTTPAGHKAIADLDAKAGEDAFFLPLVDGSADGRFCKQAAILDLYKNKKDAADAPPTAAEVLAFYASPETAAVTHRIRAYHVSEWADKPDWLGELSAAAENKKMKKAELEQMVAEQIKPTLWLTEDVARKLGLSEQGLVVTYHPIGLLMWTEARMATPVSDTAVKQATAEELAAAPDKKAETMTDDGNAAGDAYMADEAGSETKVEKQPSLEEIVDGYGNE